MRYQYTRQILLQVGVRASLIGFTFRGFYRCSRSTSFVYHTRQTVRGRARSMAEWFNLVQSIHDSQSTLIWRFLFGSLNLRSFEQRHQFNRKSKVKQVFWSNLLQFPWSRNIFARHVASRILWRSGFTGSYPILALLLQKMKKVAQKVIKKRVPFVSNTRG